MHLQKQFKTAHSSDKRYLVITMNKSVVVYSILSSPAHRWPSLPCSSSWTIGLQSCCWIILCSLEFYRLGIPCFPSFPWLTFMHALRFIWRGVYLYVTSLTLQAALVIPPHDSFLHIAWSTFQHFIILLLKWVRFVLWDSFGLFFFLFTPTPLVISSSAMPFYIIYMWMIHKSITSFDIPHFNKTCIISFLCKFLIICVIQ